MTVLDIAELTTALATAFTVIFLAWDRWDRIRLPGAGIELTSERLTGKTKRHYTLCFTVRNRAASAIRIVSVVIENPRDASVKFEGVEGVGVEVWIDVEPFEVRRFNMALDAGVILKAAETLRLDLVVTYAYLGRRTDKRTMRFHREM